MNDQVRRLVVSHFATLMFYETPRRQQQLGTTNRSMKRAGSIPTWHFQIFTTVETFSFCFVFHLFCPHEVTSENERKFLELWAESERRTANKMVTKNKQNRWMFDKMVQWPTERGESDGSERVHREVHQEQGGRLAEKGEGPNP